MRHLYLEVFGICLALWAHCAGERGQGTKQVSETGVVAESATRQGEEEGRQLTE